MTILIFSNKAAGLYDFRKELLLRLLNSNKVIVCTPYDERVNDVIEMGCEYAQCEVLNRHGINPITDIKLLYYYKKTIAQFCPDIVLTYTIKANVYGGIACRITGTHYISNITGLGTSIENGGILSAVAIGLYRIGLKKADCVFFQNRTNEQFCVEKRIAVGRTRVVSGSGVNLNQHKFETYPPSNGLTRFLFVGRIMKDKGIEELISAFDMIRKSRRDVQLDVVGWSDDNYMSLLQDAEQRGTIRFHGLQQDVHSFYKNTHCVVLPSYHEGMSNVLLEAAATGRPVITTKVPGCQETFDEGSSGFGCKAKDVESLVEAIRQFLALSYQDKAKMGLAARKKMEEVFDREKVVDSYMEEIHRIITIVP